MKKTELARNELKKMMEAFGVSVIIDGETWRLHKVSADGKICLSFRAGRNSLIEDITDVFRNDMETVFEMWDDEVRKNGSLISEEDVMVSREEFTQLGNAVCDALSGYVIVEEDDPDSNEVNSLTSVEGVMEVRIYGTDGKNFLEAWELIASALNGKACPTWMDFQPCFPFGSIRLGYYAALSEFQALGDGSYANNISHLGEWLQDSVLDREDVCFLESIEFSINYSYAEHIEESGSICLASMMNLHEAGTPLPETKTKVISSKLVPATEENLRKYGLDDCIEDEGQ